MDNCLCGPYFFILLLATQTLNIKGSVLLKPSFHPTVHYIASHLSSDFNNYTLLSTLTLVKGAVSTARLNQLVTMEQGKKKKHAKQKTKSMLLSAVW